MLKAFEQDIKDHKELGGLDWKINGNPIGETYYCRAEYKDEWWSLLILGTYNLSAKTEEFTVRLNLDSYSLSNIENNIHVCPEDLCPGVLHTSNITLLLQRGYTSIKEAMGDMASVLKQVSSISQKGNREC